MRKQCVPGALSDFSSAWKRGYYLTNNVEGWHSRMKKVITKLHPNIFAWIEFIQREEAVTKVKI